MQLILRPVSDAQLKEIIVTDGRFAIGRNEDSFKGYDGSVVAKLSRRHARIFERDGQVFIADLNSSNGTTVNGQIVEGKPVELKLNDEIQFGGLRYRVEHLGGDTRIAPEEPSVDARIVLTPTRADGSLDPIVVSKFPFLIGRYSDVFARYEESVPKALSLISKKHAQIFAHQNALYIEDLGSTNGTYVSGEKLSEKARKLVDKDTIAFGGDGMLYKVQLFIGAEIVADAKAKIEKMAEGTIFVDDATNFLEIYMGAGEKDDDAQGTEDKAEAENGTVSKNRPRDTRISRARRSFGLLRVSLRGGEPIDRRLRWTILLSLVGFGAGVAGYWYLAWPAKQINKHLDSEQYLAAAELANRYLRNRPNDDQIQDLATEATLRAFVPEWRAAVESGDNAAARQILVRARETGPNNSQDDDLLSILELAGDISTYELSESSKDVLIEMLSGDQSVSALVEQWDSQQTENARALSRIELKADGFDAYQTEFYRDLRALRKRDKELVPLRDLRRNIVASLANRDTSRLRQYIRDFSTQNPDVRGLQLLQEDLLRYEAVEQDVGEARWLRAYDRANQIEFNTAPFADHSVFMNENVLPDARTRDAHQRAAGAWMEGNAIESFDILEGLAQGPWGEVATRKLERNRRLLNALTELLGHRGAANFEDRLFTLYGQLDPESDVYLRRALYPDFQQHSEAALDRAADRTRRAEKAWNDYDASGRLHSVHRLEEQVSAEFKRLAGLLTVADQNLRESEGIYQQLGTDSPDTWISLNQDVVREIKLQTRSLGNLLVIETDVQKAKLDLLPELTTE